MEITISVDCGMRELSLDSRAYVTTDRIRDPESFRLEYRLVQLMVRIAEPIFCPVVVPAHGWLFQHIRKIVDNIR
ncbi:unnamed protein product [Allacma fusca]|uniref:Uncharacterized protein n=1 Tax=Allacma fusca TaxID=39272 RepID=A0A8J2J7H2_9HEXA|nr:unnamed protein product [Allacma fusca]